MRGAVDLISVDQFLVSLAALLIAGGAAGCQPILPITEPSQWNSTCPAGFDRSAVLDALSHIVDHGRWQLFTDRDMEAVARFQGPEVRVDWRPELDLPLSKIAEGYGDPTLHVFAARIFEHPSDDDHRLYLLIRGSAPPGKHGWLHVVSTSHRSICLSP
jgi:hypothetical protein